ncbi:MAG: hypothetical protein JO292_07150 [Betaproteobacteria bacterium]|nr:hypothetical protein [Betaproteobacteria bacterium]MBV9361152.1 hypothetical protein [Betaproteobacteria bacterium]
MKPVPSQIVSLFERNTALHGFSVRGRGDIPDNVPTTQDEGELFVGDIGIAPTVSEAQYAEIFEEVVAAVTEVLAEGEDGSERLRGRTFARALH